MSSIESLRAARVKKLELLIKSGVNPYPSKVPRDISLKQALDSFDSLQKDGKNVSLGGRVMAVRGQGSILFAVIYDGTEKFQAVFKKNAMKENDFSLFNNAVDIGDFISVTGSFFLTESGEKSVLVSSWKMCAKSLLPLPEKREGLKDPEERFRKRYLDLLSNEKTRERFLLRSRIVAEFRQILSRSGFVEVETSMLQQIPGGANAQPFKTHHNALDIDLFLRIAPELDLKKLLIGGFPKVFEIGRSFRNEGIDVTHNPEFTTIEWYEAWSDAERQRAFVEEVIKEIIKSARGEFVLSHEGTKIDFSKPFAVFSYFDLLKRAGPVPVNEKEMDAVFKKEIKPKLIQPSFVIDYPKNMLPLAKGKENSTEIVDAFQLYAGGVEIVKAFSELNDPIEQRARFEEQERRRKAGDEEAEPSDESFLEALEYGMPPAGGVGIGIERLAMLLTDSHNIRDVILFPTLRPR